MPSKGPKFKDFTFLLQTQNSQPFNDIIHLAVTRH